MEKETSTARQFCANYVCGKCTGVMMVKESATLRLWVDSNYAGKDCKPLDCTYFNNIVIPGTPKEASWTRR